MSDSGNRLIRASDPSPRGETRSESKIDTSCDALLNTIKSTCDPFKETFSSKGSALHHISEAVNALASLQGAPSQLLNTGIAQIPLLDKMPGMPAATIGAAHLGTPHAHDHPPSDGFPLPSIGATIGSGCLSVLIGGMPAARVTDIGIAPTCGGLTPYFDIQTGSSNTFIGGMRAARMGVDMTRHCNPMGHAGKSGEGAEGAVEKGEEAASEAAEVSSRARWMGRAGKAWKVGNAAVGPASGAATAADDAWQGEGEAAAMMAAQTAADAAMMLLGNLMGKDPGIEPSMGMLMDGNPTVLIGGFPMPDSQMMWHGVKHGIGKKVKPRLPRRIQELHCEFRGEPINPVTGDVRNEFVDYETDQVVPFLWGRYYSSGWCHLTGPLGYGFRHAWQHELRLLRKRAIYTDPRGTNYIFERSEEGRYRGCSGGYVLIQIDDKRFVIRHDSNGEVEFELDDDFRISARCIGLVRDVNRSILNWNADGRLVEISQTDIRDRIRRVIAFFHDRKGRIVETVLTDTDGQQYRIGRYEYDAAGRLVRYRDALGEESVYAYDAKHRVAKITDANAYSFFYRYDDEGRCVESRGQDGMWHVLFHYQPGKTTVTEGDGGEWTILYNHAGTITRVTDPYGGTMEYVIGSDGRIESEVDSGGRELRWLYDEHGRNTGRIDAWGVRTSVKDSMPRPPDPLTHLAPQSPLELHWGTASTNGTTSVVLLPAELGEIALRTMTPLSRGPEGLRERRDSVGRVIERANSTGAIEYFTYGATGDLTQWIDADGSERRYLTTSWKLNGAETDALRHTVYYRYTMRQQIASITDQNGNESIYSYDLKNRLNSVTRHGRVRESYVYDAGDRLIEKYDGAARPLIKLEVGENGQHSRRWLASGEVHMFEYDNYGNFTNASTDRYRITRSFDPRGARTSDKRNGKGVEHRYVDGRLVLTNFFDRFEIEYEAVSDGETVIRTPVGGTHRMLRGADGRILMQLGNGTNVAYAFDTDGHCTGRLIWPEIAPGKAVHVRYEYSATGELRRVVDSERGLTTYQYDPTHRLTEVAHEGWPTQHFEYDASGNLLGAPGCAWLRYAEGNRLATTARGIFHYNDRNHLSEEINGGDRRTTYRYNSMDLMVGIEWSDRSDTWTAEYDGLCRRISKSLGEHRTEFYWDDDRLAAEVSTSGRLRLYVYVNATAYVPFMFIEYPSVNAPPQSGEAHYVFHSQVGMAEWIENQTRNVVWRADDVDAYGAVEIAQDSTLEFNLRFPGHYYDCETGLHDNRFRSYSPTLRRYLQSDPAGQSGGINLYAYTANPIVSVDVLGLHVRRPPEKSDDHVHNQRNRRDFEENPPPPGKHVAKTRQANQRIRDVQKKRHLETLDAHYKALREHVARFWPDNPSKVTEYKGERAASKWMERNYPEAEMLKGFQPGVGYDQVWVIRDEAGNPITYFIVEAKGPDATLATDAKKGEQMGIDWIVNTNEEMRQSTDPNVRELGYALHNAMYNGEPEVRGIALEKVRGEFAAKKVEIPANETVNSEVWRSRLDVQGQGAPTRDGMATKGDLKRGLADPGKLETPTIADRLDPEIVKRLRSGI